MVFLMRANIKDVESFWDNNPVHSVEIPLLHDLTAFSSQCDFLRWNSYDIFAKTNFYKALFWEGKKILVMQVVGQAFVLVIMLEMV